MSVEQLEAGVMDLWRGTLNEKALAFRNRYYRQLLRARRQQLGQDPAAEADLFYPQPDADEAVAAN